MTATAKELFGARDNLLEVISMKDKFFAKVSHELRTPLNGISGFAGLLTKTDLTDEQHKWAEIILHCAEDILHVVNDILDLNKFRARKIGVKIECVNVENMLSGLVYLQALAAEKYVQMNFIVAPDVPNWIHTDEVPYLPFHSKHKLRQVLVNLLGNGIKFTHQGKIDLRITCKHKDEETNKMVLQFQIEDTGIGIKEEDIPRMFQEFVQVHEYDHIPSTGLGLAICRHIVELLEGSISVSSVYGQGSIFTFYITTQECLDDRRFKKPKAREPSQELEYSKRYPLRILLAEDNDVNRKLMLKLLANLGYEIEIAKDGAEVIDKMETQIYDLILMDIHMPKMNGLEATKWIVNNIKKNKPRIVALTASSWEIDKETYFSAGMEDVLAKPISTSRLKEVLKNAYQKRK